LVAVEQAVIAVRNQLVAVLELQQMVLATPLTAVAVAAVELHKTSLMITQVEVVVPAEVAEQ
jgi:hypothetical protein